MSSNLKKNKLILVFVENYLSTLFKYNLALFPKNIYWLISNFEIVILYSSDLDFESNQSQRKCSNTNCHKIISVNAVCVGK